MKSIRPVALVLGIAISFTLCGCGDFTVADKSKEVVLPRAEYEQLKALAGELEARGPLVVYNFAERRTKSSAADSHLTGGISAFSLFSSSGGVRVSRFRRWYCFEAGPTNSVSGPTRGETFVAGD